MIIAVAVLAGTGVSLLAVAASTARPAGAPVPGPADHRARWSALHGGLPAAGAVARWLRAVHVLAAPLARRGVAPDVLTAAAVWCAGWVIPAAVAGGRWALGAAAATAASGLVDGLDGAVAALGDRATRRGAVLDAVADRVADGLVLAGLGLAGAPWWWCLAAFAALVGQEGIRTYRRRRDGGAGGPVTPGERPTRLVLAGLGFLVAGASPAHAGGAATGAAAATLAVCAGSALVLAAGSLSRRATPR